MDGDCGVIAGENCALEHTLGTDAHLILSIGLQKTLDATARKLQERCQLSATCRRVFR